MFGGIAKVTAKPGKLDELIEFLRWDAEVSRSEPGTLRFDVWSDPNDANAVVLSEAYSDAEAVKVHQAAEPFRKFIAEVVPNLIETVVFVVPFAQSLASSIDSAG